MISSLLKRVAAILPSSTQHELRRVYFAREIKRRRFFTDEAEFALLPELLVPGDWALDVGANVGHYSMRMAELAGADGRVIALEPVPDTFALLAANVRMSPHANISVLNVAASDRTACVGMQIPNFSEGLPNYYQAKLTTNPAALRIVTIPIDSLGLPRIKLVKIDVEGHELPVLLGMRNLLQRDHPVLIVETGSDETTNFVSALGYSIQRLPGSSNILGMPHRDGMPSFRA